MALRWVVGADRDATGRIAALCNPSAGWSPRATMDVIDDIDMRRHRYFVFRPPFSLSAVQVVHGAGGSYLRTRPDSSRGNNLDRLPACADLPRQLTVRPRRNVADLSDEERAAYVAAVNELRNRYPRLPDGTDDIVNWWFKQDQSHTHGGPHEEPSFLPWHRELVNRFERLLQEVDPDVTVPYWDWTTDPRATPDRTGRLVNLMTPDFMGATDGDMGDPFRSLYDPTAVPDRDSYPGTEPEGRAALPPASVRRRLPPPNRPPDVPMGDFDWSDNRANYDTGGTVPVRNDPPPDTEFFLPYDRALLEVGYGVPEPWKAMADALRAAHGWAHRYMGGDIARAQGHYSFRDPFVFLLHSNVDRLYASWQLRQRGDKELLPWRLEPSQIYGAQQSEPSMRRKMDPWSGGSLSIPPWDAPGQAEVHTTDAGVVRPTLYDRYVYDDDLCAAWATLLLARTLPGGDVIPATIEYDVVAPGSTAFRLVLGPECGWWKGLGVPTADGDHTLLEVDKDNRQAEVVVPTAGLGGGTLEFRRREWDFWPFSTVRRLVHRVADLDLVPDRARVTFLWERE